MEWRHHNHGALAALAAVALAVPAVASARAATPPATLVDAATPLATLVDADMTEPSEARPHGISVDWARRPRIGLDDDPGRFTAFIPWGHAYTCAAGDPQPSARVELQGLRAFVRSKRTGAWKELPGTGIVGAAYREDYRDDDRRQVATPATASGGISVPVGGGRNFHFWWATGRVKIDPTDVGGVLVTLRARLDASTVDGAKPAPCIVLGTGADYWRSTTSKWNGTGVNNGDVGIGRLKRVQSTWRVYTMSTVPGTGLGPLPASAPATASELR